MPGLRSLNKRSNSCSLGPVIQPSMPMPELTARSSAGSPFAEGLLALFLFGCVALVAFLAWRLRQSKKATSTTTVLEGIVKTAADAFRLEVDQTLTRFHSTFVWEEAGRRRTHNSFFLDTAEGPTAIEVDAHTEFVVDTPNETYWHDGERRVRAFVVRQGMRVFVELAPGTRRATRVALEPPLKQQARRVARAKSTLAVGVASVAIAAAVSHQSILCSLLGRDTEATVLSSELVSPRSKWARMEVTFQTPSGQQAVDDLAAYAQSLHAGQTIPVREVAFAGWWTGIGHGPRVSAISYHFSTLGLLQVLLIVWAFRPKPVRFHALREAHTAPTPTNAVGRWIRSDR